MSRHCDARYTILYRADYASRRLTLRHAAASAAEYAATADANIVTTEIPDGPH